MNKSKNKKNQISPFAELAHAIMTTPALPAPKKTFAESLKEAPDLIRACNAFQALDRLAKQGLLTITTEDGDGCHVSFFPSKGGVHQTVRPALLEAVEALITHPACSIE